MYHFCMIEHLQKREAHDVITSTEVPILFGAEKYKTYYQLLYEKKHKTEEYKDNPRMRFGRALEPVIASLAMEELGLKGKPYKTFIKDNDLKIGASFDYILRHATKGAPISEDYALLECKNVDSLVFKRDWYEDASHGLMAPDHIELQCQQQMMLYPIDRLYIVALVGGNELHIAERRFSKEIAKMIVEKVADFWEDAKRPMSEFEVGLSSADFYLQNNQLINKGAVYNDTDTRFKKFVDAHLLLSKRKKEIENSIKLNKAHIVKMAEGHEKIIGPGYRISLGMSKETIVPEHTRKSYRTFQITGEMNLEKNTN